MSTGRPAYHFIAPQGWMNDPCAPGYDPKTGIFHLFYQWNPKSHAWGNISWGHAQSKDMLHWKHDSQDIPSLAPDQPYDRDGVFTGCFVPNGPKGEPDQLTVFYTSISALPVHYTLPHVRGSEGLSMATSSDGGRTWIKSDSNPILEAEPSSDELAGVGEQESVKVTGFRDPYVFRWPLMDRDRSKTDGLYGLISGGVIGGTAGPRLFLYEIDRHDLTKWTFITTLPSWQPGLAAAGVAGANAECGSVISLSSTSGWSRDFILVGVEGVPGQSKVDESLPHGPARSQLWQRISNDTGLVYDGSTEGGRLDHGIFYAAAPFRHPDGRIIVWGWLSEDDLPESEQERKGWNGCFGVPRELFLLELEGVWREPSFEDLPATSEQSSRFSTLGIRPLSELRSLRLGTEPCGQLCRLQGVSAAIPWRLLQRSPLKCELVAIFEVSKDCTEVGIIIRHNEDYSIQTRIVYHPRQREIRIIRSKSTTDPAINVSDVVGTFDLLRKREGSLDEVQYEPLCLNIFTDHDALEVFVNDRFVMSTWIYSPPDCTGISLLWNGELPKRKDETGSQNPQQYWDDNARLIEASIWELGSTTL